MQNKKQQQKKKRLPSDKTRFLKESIDFSSDSVLKFDSLCPGSPGNFFFILKLPFVRGKPHTTEGPTPLQSQYPSDTKTIEEAIEDGIYCILRSIRVAGQLVRSPVDHEAANASTNVGPKHRQMRDKRRGMGHRQGRPDMREVRANVIRVRARFVR